MILTCPSCTMRYIVAEGAVGPEGRRVRCAHCGHQWFQEGEIGLDEELFGPSAPSDDFPEAVDFPEDAEVEIEFEDHPVEDVDAPEETPFQSILQKEIEGVDIPHGVRPVQHHEELIIPVKMKKRIKLPAGNRVGGFAAAALVWLILCGILVLCQPQISRAWPPSNMIYTLLGLTPAAPGDGLALDNLQAELKAGKIVMTGEIINLKSAELPVPAIMAMIVDGDDKIIDRVLIAPPAETIKGEATLSFDVVYPSLPKGAANVNFAFTFLKAPAAKAEEKIPAKVETPPAKAEVEHAPSAPKPEETPHH